MDRFDDIDRIAIERYSHNLKWELFHRYLVKKNKGIRKEALRDLEEFIVEFRNWEYQDQKDFVLSIVDFEDEIPNTTSSYFATPLSLMMQDFMNDWIKSENNDSTPFRWLAQKNNDTEMARKALSINPNDDLARLVIINAYLDKIYWSTHSLPHHFSGDIDEILAIYPTCLEEIKQLENRENQRKYTAELQEEIQVVKDYKKSQE
ncbi:hypothetical protein [Empedobacter sedimenti]|uniref:hypothetical protein n=1 Tax=Empedobacter sedimenti TaxID=3042610 RepID=UPI0024A7439F|nr:hypothetical protein [Empedobacter sedimenti]